jgi:hypothetical protein
MKAMASFMDPEEDYLTLCSFEDEANAAEARRRKELEEAHAKLKCLSCGFYCLSHCSHLPCSGHFISTDESTRRSPQRRYPSSQCTLIGSTRAILE